jgi:hypothetical protein
MSWLIAIGVVTIVFFAALAILATIASGRDSRAEEQRRYSDAPFDRKDGPPTAD